MQADGAIPDGTVSLVMALFADYGRHLDLERDPGAWAELFGTDGVLVVGDREISGAEKLMKFAAGSIPGVHVQAVPQLRAQPGGGLDAITSFIFMTTETKDFRSGYYTDHLVWQGDRLIFARRRIQLLARTDG
jgi:hypothetical protein